MKNKQDKSYYINRAINDFKSLVIYFNVTRPQYEHNYHRDGKFSLDKLQKQFDFLSGWNKRSASDKRDLAKLYATYSKTFNLTFGIPYHLVEKVLGCYRDANGKKIRISIDEVVPKLVEEGFMTEINAGRKVDYKTHEVKCYWTKKYLLKNVKYWFNLFNDKRYHDISTFPSASSRIKKIIFDFVRSFSKEEKKETPIISQNKIMEYFNGMSEDMRSIYNECKANLKEGIITIDEFATILKQNNVADWFIAVCVNGYNSKKSEKVSK